MSSFLFVRIVWSLGLNFDIILRNYFAWSIFLLENYHIYNSTVPSNPLTGEQILYIPYPNAGNMMWIKCNYLLITHMKIVPSDFFSYCYWFKGEKSTQSTVKAAIIIVSYRLCFFEQL